MCKRKVVAIKLKEPLRPRKEELRRLFGFEVLHKRYRRLFKVDTVRCKLRRTVTYCIGGAPDFAPYRIGRMGYARSRFAAIFVAYCFKNPRHLYRCASDHPPRARITLRGGLQFLCRIDVSVAVYRYRQILHEPGAHSFAAAGADGL